MESGPTSNKSRSGRQSDDQIAASLAGYSLREVVAITGLSKQALYAWERRYAIVTPNRDENGTRLYSDEEVHRLQLLKRCVENGYRIGKIASLELSELKRCARAADAAQKISIKELVNAVEALDADFIEHWLPIHFSALGPHRFARDLVMPLMAAVGDCVETGRASIVGEHFLSAIVRTFVGQALRHSRNPVTGPTVLFTTAKGELHEIGLIVAAVCAQRVGARVNYLGPQLPGQEIAIASSAFRARLVCMSASCQLPSVLRREAAEIRSVLPTDIELWFGGRAAAELDEGQWQGLRVFADIHDFEDAIGRLCGRMGQR